MFAFTGLVASMLARFLAPSKRAGSRFVSAFAGMLGAVTGGLLGRTFGLHGAAKEQAGFFLSMAGAVILVMAYHAYARRRASA
jgi:uncharacterized membrane protein YeaQ/YmgE (transglycosylase-associated protein family)